MELRLFSMFSVVVVHDGTFHTQIVVKLILKLLFYMFNVFHSELLIKRIQYVNVI